MRLFLLVFFIPFLQIYSQPNSSDLNSPENVLLFADFLFCEKDYLRAVEEYEKYLSVINNDTAAFQIGLAYLNMTNYKKAKDKFSLLFKSNSFSNESRIFYFKSIFLDKDFDELHSHYSNKNIIQPEEKIYEIFLKQYYFSNLFKENELPEKNNFITAFGENEKSEIISFYERKKNPPHKNPLTASLLSAIIPGAGKIYAGKTGDGITAFLATSLLAFLSYNNFENHHNTRGWVFAGLASFFYAGNIYGSAAAAQLYNAEIRYKFENDLIRYLEKQNYFVPEYDYCK
jgi:hypothetical protein